MKDIAKGGWGGVGFGGAFIGVDAPAPGAAAGLMNPTLRVFLVPPAAGKRETAELAAAGEAGFRGLAPAAPELAGRPPAPPATRGGGGGEIARESGYESGGLRQQVLNGQTYLLAWPGLPQYAADSFPPGCPPAMLRCRLLTERMRPWRCLPPADSEGPDPVPKAAHPAHRHQQHPTGTTGGHHKHTQQGRAAPHHNHDCTVQGKAGHCFLFGEHLSSRHSPAAMRAAEAVLEGEGSGVVEATLQGKEHPGLLTRAAEAGGQLAASAAGAVKHTVERATGAQCCRIAAALSCWCCWILTFNNSAAAESCAVLPLRYNLTFPPACPVCCRHRP
jgi:hypothetical protein